MSQPALLAPATYRELPPLATYDRLWKATLERRGHQAKAVVLETGLRVSYVHCKGVRDGAIE